jgi:hypothetical protein
MTVNQALIIVAAGLLVLSTVGAVAAHFWL